VPEVLAADLRREGINHADLNGRLFIKTPWYLADRRAHSRRYRSPVSTLDLFSLKTSRLVRALLAQRDHVWTQAELTARTSLSRGLVSQALAELTEEDLVVRTAAPTRETPARYRLEAFDRLLDAWKTADKWTERTEVREYSVLTGDVTELAGTVRDILRDKTGEVRGVFTQWFAAHLRQPYTDSPVVSVYVKRDTELVLPFARRVTHGGNLWLVVPADDGVWQETQEVQGFPLVSDIQIYLDLLQVGQRGPEQAEALRRWEGFAR
jgi:DNA-binding HxlR family transcriptional regulator